MSATAMYRGLVPNRLSGGAYQGRLQEFILTANSATGFFKNDIVNVGAGVITPITATPTTTRNGNTPQGIVTGVAYYNQYGPVSAMYLPANGYTSFSTYGPITISVLVDPELTFFIQANGSVAATAVGKNAALAGFSSGSTFTGNSAVRLDSATVATTNTLAVRILEIPAQDADGGANAAGDAFTWVRCQWNQGVHADTNATGV